MTWDTTHDNLENVARFIEQHSNGVTVQEIADAFAVNRSTAHRWLEKLDSRYGVESVSGQRGRYRMAEPVGSVRLRKAEALTVYLALRRFVRQTNKAPQFMFTAIEKVIGVVAREDLRSTLMQSAAYVQEHRPTASEHETDIWQTLLDGWMNRQIVAIDYLKPSKQTPDRHHCEIYLFEPMTNGDGVYVIVWSHERDAIREFKIDRIKRASLTGQAFEPRGELHIDQLLKHGMGVWMNDANHPLQRVVLHFAPHKARRVEESTYIEVEEKQRQPDGSLIWTAEVAALREIKHWILGWGAGVEVLEPQNLRDEIAAELKLAAAQYRK